MTKPADPVYDPEDLVWLARDLPLMKLSAESLAREALSQSVAALEAGQTGQDGADLDPLAGGFVRCLTVYDPDIRDDLLLGNGHRSLQTLGGLLAMLAPLPGDAEALEACVAEAGPKPWAVGLADQMCREADIDHPIAITIHRLRDLLGEIPKRPVELWRIDEVPAAELAAFKQEMAAVYAKGGSDAAHTFMQATMAADRNNVLARYLRYKRQR